MTYITVVFKTCLSFNSGSVMTLVNCSCYCSHIDCHGTLWGCFSLRISCLHLKCTNYDIRIKKKNVFSCSVLEATCLVQTPLERLGKVELCGGLTTKFSLNLLVFIPHHTLYKILVIPPFFMFSLFQQNTLICSVHLLISLKNIESNESP